MEFNRIKGSLDQSDIILLDNLGNGGMENPALISSILELIDSDEFIDCIGNEKALSLFRLLREYFNSCFSIYIDGSIGASVLEKLLEYTENTVYYVNSTNGERVATVNEVNSGVEQLIQKKIPAIDDNIAKYLNLLMWTFTGRVRYYGRAGLKYTYEDNKLKESFYQLVIRAGSILREMVDWISIGGNYDRAIAALKISKKSSKYKYPSFATDEITCTYSPKQIYYFCKKSLVNGVYTETQREARRVLYLMETRGYKPSPYDIANMRKAYSEVLHGNPYDYSNITNEEARNICIRLDNAGLQDRNNNFAMKVVSTIKRTGKVSDKQLLVLRSAIAELDRKNSSNDKRVTDNIKDNEDELSELFQLSDALGSGKIGG